MWGFGCENVIWRHGSSLYEREREREREKGVGFEVQM